MKNRRTKTKPVIFGLAFMFILLSAIALSSCKKNDGGGGNKQIVGTWTCSHHYYGGSDTFVFKSNGKYQWNGPSPFPSHSGDYSFNGVILTISKTSGSTNVYTILSLTDSYFVMMDEDGDSYTYYK